MISKMNYLLLSSMMIAVIDNSYGRCCDCCKKLCGDKDSSGSSMEEKLIKENESVMPINMNANIHNENNFTGNIGNNHGFHNTNENNDFLLENNSKNNYDSNQVPLIQENNDINKGDKDRKEKTQRCTNSNKAGQDENI